MVSTVEEQVIKRELPKALTNFIFLIASGKFFKVNPWAPMIAKGLDVISALVLNTLIITIKKGKMNIHRSITRIANLSICMTFLLIAAFLFSFIYNFFIMIYQRIINFKHVINTIFNLFCIV